MQAREFGTGHSYLHKACEKPLGERVGVIWRLRNGISQMISNVAWGSGGAWDTFVWLLMSGGRAGRASRETYFALADPCGVAVVQGTKSLALQAANTLLSSQIERLGAGTRMGWHSAREHQKIAARCPPKTLTKMQEPGTRTQYRGPSRKKRRANCADTVGDGLNPHVWLASTARNLYMLRRRPALIGRLSRDPPQASGTLTTPTKSRKNGAKKKARKNRQRAGHAQPSTSLAFESSQTPKRPC